MTQLSSSVPALSPVAVATVEGVGASIKALRPMGAVVEGLDLSASAPPPAAVVKALEQVMEKDVPKHLIALMKLRPEVAAVVAYLPPVLQHNLLEV